MSTIRADTLSNRLATKSRPTADVLDGAARAWVNFVGVGTVSIRASFNVSSITDNGVGDWTVNFTNALPDKNFSASVVSDGNFTAGSGVSSWMWWTVFALNTASSCRIRAASYVGTTNTLSLNDNDMNVNIFR